MHTPKRNIRTSILSTNEVKNFLKGILLILLFLASQSIFAQVGIGNTDPKATLDITASNAGSPSSTDGILVPRVNTLTFTGLTSDQNGMLVYLTTDVTISTIPYTKGFYYWDNVATWIPISQGDKNTLDQAYDEGGAGVGRTIIATDGVVTIAGQDGFLVTGTRGTGDDVSISGEGTRLFFNPQKSAFRAGYVSGAQWDNANVGSNSTAMGSSTEASGGNSIALGFNTTASGHTSTAIGNSNIASGQNSTAMGINNVASGIHSTAIGNQTTASGNESTSMGFLTNAIGSASTAIGAQTTASGGASTAMGGLTTASGVGSLATGDTTIASGRYSTTFGRDTNASEDYSIAMGEHTIASAERSIAMGEATLASGINSTAMGSFTNATGENSIAMGNYTLATGNNSTTMGFNATASGDNSTAMGSGTTASGFNSTAMGSDTTASGANSTAMGSGTESFSGFEISIGRYNTNYSPSNVNGFDINDRLFAIGNGLNGSNRSNALTIYKSGLMNINDAYNMPLTDGSVNQIMATDGSGQVNFVDASSIITEDADWYTESSNSVPNLITDNIFTYGNVGIGLNNPIRALEIEETDDSKPVAVAISKIDNSTTLGTNALTISKTTNGNALAYGVANAMDGSGSGKHIAIINTINSTGSGQKSAIYNSFNNSSGIHKGINTAFNSPTTGIVYGIHNEFEDGLSTQYGIRNDFDSSTTGNQIGLYNAYNSGSTGDKNGIYSIFGQNSGGDQTAFHSQFYSTSNTNKKAFRTSFSATTGGTIYGAEIIVNATGNSDKYGLFVNFDAGVTGSNNYGIYSEVDQNDGFAGYFLGRLSIGTTTANTYILPNSRGTNGQIMTSDAVGNVTWNLLNANNGLSVDAASNTIQLGGPLTEDTAITYGSFDTRFNLNDTGDFIIQDNGTNKLTVLDNGDTVLGGDLYWRDENTGGTVLGRFIDDDNDGRFQIYENNSVSISLDANGTSIFNEQGLNRDFRIESDDLENMLLVDAGNNYIGIAGTPDTDFHIFHGGSGSTNGLKIQNRGANNNWWRMYTVNSNGNLNLYSRLQGTASVGNFNDTSGAYSATSDRRLKKDFKPLRFSWETFMELETLSYLYKSQKNNTRSLGLIAQDVKIIYPELVNYNEQDDIYHMNYSGFGVIAIKAVQKLKEEVDTLKTENAILKAKLEKLETLESRILTLENATTSNNRIEVIKED